MDYGNNTYLEIKKAYQRERIMLGVLNALIVLMLFIGFPKTEAPVEKTGFYGFYLLGIYVAVIVIFVLFGITGAVIRSVKWKKMLQSLGCMSDEDAQRMMSHAKPLYQPLYPNYVPRYYIMDDIIINFNSVKAYEISKIINIKKRENRNFKAGCIIDIEISCSPYHDKIAMRIQEERDMIYHNMVSALKKSVSGTVNK